MSILRYVTLTGVDMHTDLKELVRLSEEYPFVEWGVLYDESVAGTQPRYPTLKWIGCFAQLAEDAGLNVALHLCGSAVTRLRKLYQGPADFPRRTPETATEFDLLDLAQRFGRVQLNTVAKLDHVEPLRRLIQSISRSEARTRVMLQWHERHAEVCARLQSTDAFEVVVDSSGGRGVSPLEWPAVDWSHKRVGYAGGLGPDNLEAQLPEIAKVAAGRAFCVDMETKLRTADDLLDLARCERVLAIAAEYDEKSRFAQGAVYGHLLQLTRDLEGFWLDWWVGHALGYDMVVPPKDACRAVYLYRPTGKFESFSPSDDGGLAVRLFHSEQIALTPLPSVEHLLAEAPELAEQLQEPLDDADDEAEPRASWTAKALGDDGLLMPGSSLVEAGLRAIVAKHFGMALSTNPMAPPPFGD